MNKLKIALLGNQGSGKTTLARAIDQHYGAEILSFASPIKAMASKLLYSLTGGRTPQEHILQDILTGVIPKDRAFSLDGVQFKEGELREILQFLGQGLRDIHGENTWVDILLRYARTHLLFNLVVDDTRYANEIVQLHEEGFGIIFIDNGVDEIGGHSSERCKTQLKQSGVEPMLRLMYSDGEAINTQRVINLCKELLNR